MVYFKSNQTVFPAYISRESSVIRDQSPARERSKAIIGNIRFDARTIGSCPSLIYQYSKMAPRFSGQTSIFIYEIKEFGLKTDL